MDEYLEALELSSGWSMEELEQAYKDQLRVWHPDRFGHDQKLQARAQRKTQEIHLAYSRLKSIGPVKRRAGRSASFASAQRPSMFEPEAESAVEKDDLETFSQSFIKGTMFDTSVPPAKPLPPIIHPLLMGVLSLSAIATVCFLFMQRLSAETPKPTEVQEIAMVLPAQAAKVQPKAAKRVPTPVRKAVSSQKSVRTTQTVSTQRVASVQAKSSMTGAAKRDDHLVPLDSFAARAVGRPALITAAMQCNPGMAQQLLKEGNDPNVRDKDGETPLIWAAKQNCAAVARLLVSHGAKQNLKGGNGFTAYGWAKWSKNLELQRMLRP